MSSAQSNTQRPASSVISTKVFSRVPFDEKVEILPPNFLGQSLSEVYDALMLKKVDRKNEFESSAEFALKRDQAKASIVSGNVRGTSKLAFVFPSPSEGILVDDAPSGIYSEYDADKQEMKVDLMMTKPFQLNEKPYPYYKNLDTPEFIKSAAVMWGGSVHSLRKGLASNAFGAHSMVSYGKFVEYGLEITIDDAWRIRALQDDPFFGIASTTFHVAPSDAASLKSRLRVLVVCELKDGLIDQGQAYHAATLSEPKDTYVAYKMLKVTAESLWVFDRLTGKVYVKGMELVANYPDQNVSAY